MTDNNNNNNNNKIIIIIMMIIIITTIILIIIIIGTSVCDKNHSLIIIVPVMAMTLGENCVLLLI